ncbi:hypothetical protein COMNV_00240 [Commensalibacter sp. Nvir]|uniref:sterol desaturase family protein n=1 Tax=Commensalibacter sp. Nvir TaxID=3069817 RepID=UPI002D30ED06|nr:hypothetical protein COMNV_00240 [Commensalibacter sp. Nvir]
MKQRSIFEIICHNKPPFKRSHDLENLNLKQLWVAYLSHKTILLYISLILASIFGAYYSFTDWSAIINTALIMMFGFSFIWYIIHRWIMHVRFLYRIKWTSSLWKRIHFDHHQDPYLFDTLFGSPLAIIPTILIIGAGIGYIVGGISGIFISLAVALYMSCFYEFFHCIQHLNYKPRSEYVARIKQVHLLHHFHDELGNFGITNYFWDKLFGTFYEDSRSRPESPTAFNIGYTIKEAERYPWVMLKTGAPPLDRPENSISNQQKKITNQNQEAA